MLAEDHHLHYQSLHAAHVLRPAAKREGQLELVQPERLQTAKGALTTLHLRWMPKAAASVAQNATSGNFVTWLLFQRKQRTTPRGNLN